MTRAVAVLVAVLGLACGGGGEDEGDGKTGHIGVPPVVELKPDCMGLCEHTAYCWTQEGKALGADESDCKSACEQPGGSYVHMGPVAWMCVNAACGQAFDDCNGNALGAIIAAGMAGAPLEPPPDWPSGFPMFYGGLLVPMPPMGAMKTTVLGFTLPPKDLATAVRAELLRNKWIIAASEDADEPGTEDHVRMHTTGPNGVAVDVSIYAAEGTTVLQVMY
jgi:hypothetical protein